MTIRVERVHEQPGPQDGFRVLVDRLWPRGVSKQRAALDLWLKQVAPSDALRRRFHGGEIDFAEFVGAYRSELDANPHVEELREVLATHDVVTLLYAARDQEHNHALVLRDWIEEHPAR